MLNKPLVAVSVLAVLAACGGDGGGANSTLDANASTVRVFGDDSGIMRVVREDGSQGLFMISDVAEQVSLFNSNDAESDFNDTTDLSSSGTVVGGATQLEGASTIGNLAGNITALEHPDGVARIVYLEVPNYTAIAGAAGNPVGSLPSGSFTYQGTLATGLRTQDPQLEYGTFTMDADFNAQTFDFNGQTASDTLQATGAIDVADGQFTSSNVLFVTSGTQRGGRLYGSIHGPNGETVSGLAHSNESSPVYGAAFVSTN